MTTFSSHDQSPASQGSPIIYPPKDGTFDELVSSDGSVRPHWQGLLNTFSGLHQDARRRAHETAARMLHDDGMTYLARQDNQQAARPWQLDLFPLLISQSEWQQLEAGLIQRARLLNHILNDLYGPQQLIKNGTLPPAVVFGNPQFLRPCHGVPVQGGTYLHFLAVDLARSPDGQWWILRDRTEAPTGAGFALENRTIVSRALPHVFTQTPVQHLSAFFQTFSDHVLQFAQRDDPLAVVLSPGPQNATYFEHAYLARHLGFPVVEGADLTMRDTRLFLKTVEGLKPVDLVLRRIYSDLCDPLELNTESVSGVPGLMQAIRAGQVTMVNALGSGLVDSEVLLSFLPGVCQYFFNEGLKIPSVATWWCGQPKEQSLVLERLDELMIRQVLSSTRASPQSHISSFGTDLSRQSKEQLRQAIIRRGHEFVGREIVSPSTAPFWSNQESLKPVPMTLRMYITASPHGYTVMPGGLTRVSVQSDPRGHWHEPGDFSKDTWMLWEGHEHIPNSVPHVPQALNLRRGGRDLPSRTADNFFWFGRYLERAEGAIRVLRSLVERLSGASELGADPEMLNRLVSLLVVQEHLSPRRARRVLVGGAKAVERELRTILFDPDSPDGLAKILMNVRLTADRVRERLSIDTWKILMELTNIPQEWRRTKGQSIDDTIRLLSRMIQHLAALNGMVMENMTRSYAWRFLEMGRRLERVRHLSKLVRHLTTRRSPATTGALNLLLELADSYITYRTRYKSEANLAAVLDLLLADETNPRSVIFQLVTFETHMEMLPYDRSQAKLAPALQITTRLCTELRLADMVRLSAMNERSGVRSHLERLIRQLEQGVQKVSDEVMHMYFSHSMPKRV
ncbi:circularly permuted type 2 ATP-grasp protein [Nitrospira sp. M1]